MKLLRIMSICLFFYFLGTSASAQIKNQISFCLDKKTQKRYSGVYQHRNQDGQVILAANYVKGIKQGFASWFFETGELRAQGNFLEGEKQGEWVYFNVNGSLHCRAYYDKGMPNGIWQFFDLQGELVCEAIYNGGLRVDVVSKFFPKPNLNLSY